MKEITKYAADDGTVFETAKEALAYEQLLQQLAEVDSLLRPVPNTVEFANGEGYVQQDQFGINCYHQMLSQITERLSSMDTKSCWWVCRLLDDNDEPWAKPLRRKWNRLLCIDKLSREWGQPYYANHPEDGTQVEVSHAN